MINIKGTIFNIQKFCVNDGPGIRTTVFLKGCPLNCIWCHNPESNKAIPELFYNYEKCIACGNCVEACKNSAHIIKDNLHLFDRNCCTVCGKCAEVCFSDALEIMGKTALSEEIIAEVLRDKDFYDNSGGGLTLSGGEPMMQFEFAYNLLKKAKENRLHTCIETCGFADSEKFQKIAPLVDIFLFDFKECDSSRHKEYTGVGNELIIENLKMLDSMGSKTILRCPIIPTLNDRKEHFEKIAKLANSLKNVIEINIEPYHPLGSSKSEFLGKEYKLKALTFPENDTVEKWIEEISKLTDVEVKKA